MRNHIKLFLIFLVAPLARYGIELSRQEMVIKNTLNFLEEIIFILILLGFSLLFSPSKWRTPIQSWLFIFFLLSFWLEWIYDISLHSFISPSTIFILMETDLREVSEFLNFYATPYSIVVTVVLALWAIVGFRILLSSSKQIELSSTKRVFVLLIVLCLLVADKKSALIVYNTPYLVLQSIYKYNKNQGDFKENRLNKNGPFSPTLTNLFPGPELHVVVIGESTSKVHMGIYDYYRDSTPKLDSMRLSLSVYQDVISSHTYSVGALTHALTLKNNQNDEKIENGSIIQLLNAAGYYTYWLSAQRPLGPFDSTISKLAVAADSSLFLSYDSTTESKLLDEKLLPHFQRILDRPEQKKVIFVQLMGTHYDYKKRYPSHFAYFRDKPRSPYGANEDIAQVINEYDNAIRYTDYIIVKLIEKVAQKRCYSTVLYFSDHGEEVYDNSSFAGHLEEKATRNMYTIPFLLWQSEPFKQFRKLPIDINRKYVTDDLFHSIADLVGVQAKEVDSTLSIFNASFHSKKRIVGNGVDFDLRYSKSKSSYEQN